MVDSAGKKQENRICLERRFAAERESLPEIMVWLQRQSELLLPPAQALRLQLAAEEAVVNIVDYAYADGAPDKYLQMTLLQEEGLLTLTLEDAGQPFDPLAGCLPDAAAPLEARRTGGWGMAMLQRFTDAAAYERQQEKNILRLSLRLQDEAL